MAALPTESWPEAPPRDRARRIARDKHVKVPAHANRYDARVEPPAPGEHQPTKSVCGADEADELQAFLNAHHAPVKNSPGWPARVCRPGTGRTAWPTPPGSLRPHVSMNKAKSPVLENRATSPGHLSSLADGATSIVAYAQYARDVFVSSASAARELLGVPRDVRGNRLSRCGDGRRTGRRGVRRSATWPALRPSRAANGPHSLGAIHTWTIGVSRPALIEPGGHVPCLVRDADNDFLETPAQIPVHVPLHQRTAPVDELGIGERYVAGREHRRDQRSLVTVHLVDERLGLVRIEEARRRGGRRS